MSEIYGITENEIGWTILSEYLKTGSLVGIYFRDELSDLETEQKSMSRR